ncbi:ferredoxin--NADP reductase [Pontiella sulfatireligans]|uniref:Ferredoxin--NADP reductase n=1 Tax=Pontiella sulfatireligans TaxID=2750658 RepID=A0A6C2UPN9_9BACT|nr:FAD-binding oxidoreductase [Pontiella sulfatireligans]VGO22270.1 Ferredoxin--NADP reductase [Pontiella sulfatireligans]
MSNAESELKPQLLTRHEEIAPGVFVIGFKRQHDFKPGQAIKLGIDQEQPPRIYSICSGANDDELSVLFNIKEDGFLTPKLAELSAGDTVFASAPYGTFLGTNDPAWWIATGTGIAPFRSMVRSGMTRSKTLVHGVRHLNQFYFQDDLAAALGDSYHRCCSAEQADGVYAGRVTAFLAGQPQLPQDVRYYICGQATMAVEVRDLLIAKGIPFGNIVTEIYF